MSALETVMVTRVVIVRACAVVGDTVMVHGRPAVVVDLLAARERCRATATGDRRSALPRQQAQPALRGSALALPRLPCHLHACRLGGGALIGKLRNLLHQLCAALSVTKGSRSTLPSVPVVARTGLSAYRRPRRGSG